MVVRWLVVVMKWWLSLGGKVVAMVLERERERWWWVKLEMVSFSVLCLCVSCSCLLLMELDHGVGGMERGTGGSRISWLSTAEHGGGDGMEMVMVDDLCSSFLFLFLFFFF